MDAVIMCGGAGTRLDRGEKPLFEIGDTPMVDRVLEALAASRIDAIRAVTSPLARETGRHLDGRVRMIETGGEGYVADLQEALEVVDRPVLTVVADLPLLSAELVDRTLDANEGGSLTVCVPAVLKRRLGVTAETTRVHGGVELAPTGVNVVGVDDEETIHVSYDARLAINVNRPGDVTVAEAFADATDGGEDGP